jgi:hypothetical protein
MPEEPKPPPETPPADEAEAVARLDWDAMAEITDDDKAKARKMWRESVPPKLANLLDAKVEPKE